MTPTEALRQALNGLLDERRPELDRGIREMVITIKFERDSPEPRVFDTIERERRKAPRTPKSGGAGHRPSSSSWS